MTAGYSGRPLAQKLGLAPKTRMRLVNPPPGFLEALGPLPEGARRVRSGEADYTHLFARRQADLEAVPDLQARIPAGGMLWISWPKKSSRAPTDLTEDRIRDAVLPSGWVDVKVAAVDETWSALKFLRRVHPSDKPGRPTAEEAARRAPPRRGRGR